MMGVQNRHEWREFNVMRAVRRVNIDVDEFVVNNTNMSDVDFKDVSVRHEECFGKQWNDWFRGEKYCDNFV